MLVIQKGFFTGICGDKIEETKVLRF